MKTLAKLAFSVIVVIFFVRCSSSEKPEVVAEKFLKHIDKNEFKEAKEISTEATSQFIEILENLSKYSPKKETEKKYENFKATINGDNAIVKFTVDGKEDSLKLVKRDNKWLVDIKKELGGDFGVNDIMETLEDTTNVNDSSRVVD